MIFKQFFVVSQTRLMFVDIFNKLYKDIEFLSIFSITVFRKLYKDIDIVFNDRSTDCVIL